MKTLSLLSTASLNQPEFPGRYVRPERANCEDETIIKKLILSNKILFIKKSIYEIFMPWYKQIFKRESSNILIFY